MLFNITAISYRYNHNYRELKCFVKDNMVTVGFKPLTSCFIISRETVNLYTAGAPWKEKLTVSGVGVVGSNPRFMLYPNVFEVSFFSFLPVPKNPRMSDDGLMNKDHAFKKACTKTYNLSTYRFSGL